MALADIFRKLMAKRADVSARPQAGLRFGLPWPLLAALCIILICAVAWAFFMGLMVGRGQSPQSGIAAITGIKAPQTETETGRQDSEVAGTEEQEQTLQPEEAPQVAETPRPTSQPRQGAQSAQVARKPAPNPAPAAKKPAADNGRYDYVFQAAAYRNQSEANEASAKLVKSGFRASVRKSGKVWLIIVNLRGGQTQVDSLTQKMHSLKMGKPMQLSKKEIGKKAR